MIRAADIIDQDTSHVITITGNLTLSIIHASVFADATAANLTVTLPDASAYKGKQFTIKKKDSSANTVTIATTNSQLIDGASTVVLTGQYGVLRVRSDGTNWYAIVNSPASGTDAFNGGTITSPLVVSGNSANELTVGPNGSTNPSLNIDASTASAATGVNIKSAAAGGGVAISALSSQANEQMKVDGKGTGAVSVGGVSTGPVILGRGAKEVPIMSNTLSVLAAGNQTLTAAQLLGGIIEHPVTGATTDTTDTGANIDAAIPNAANGDTFELMLINTGNNAITLAAGTGITLKGSTTTIGANKTGFLMFVRTGSATYNCYVTVSA